MILAWLWRYEDIKQIIALIIVWRSINHRAIELAGISFSYFKIIPTLESTFTCRSSIVAINLNGKIDLLVKSKVSITCNFRITC